MRPLRLAFMGTPDFAVPALERLIAEGHDLRLVLTQPPRPAGRGHRLRRSPVHELAERHGIPVHTPERLKGDAAIVEELTGLDLDVAVVVAYGLILPREVLEAPRLGALNIHASLLPRWRGAAPIQRAILAGDRETGITIMKMDEGLDTGPILARRAIAIRPDETAGTLHDRLAALGAEMIAEVLPAYAFGSLTPRPQPQEGVTYARKIEKRETRIDWGEDAPALARRIRAFSPAPGARAWLDGEPLKILMARPSGHVGKEGAPPGTVLAASPLVVACGDGAVEITRLQRPGRAPLEAEEFLRGFRIEPGMRFEPAPAGKASA
ncbi:MAG: methionyl-tRNA formyltransferase [Alphaproteobacteria bacterium]|nr:MAG: methionyl-tRNA formyltransferase [Alphaproteobacteria bacterium]